MGTAHIMTRTNILEKGAIIQRDLETFLISPHIPGGFAGPALLRKIADVAEKYNAKYVKLTGSQRIAIIGIREADLDNAWAEFEDRSTAIGPTIRSIKICPGTRACKKARQDSPELGFALDQKFYGQPAQGKFKMGVSGCPNCCSDSWMKDIGFYGTADGYTMVVGGKGGGQPMLGRQLASGLTAEQAVTLADNVIRFYKKNAKAHERLGSTLERVGFDMLVNAVT